MKANSTPWRTTLKLLSLFLNKKLLLPIFAFLLVFTNLNAQTCPDLIPTLSATTTCDGGAYALSLAGVAGTGAAPYSLTINGTTYPGVTVGSTIASFTMPSVNLWPAGLAEAALALPSGNADADNGGPVELGMKFQSSVSGFVKGIRFYNGANTAGTFTGKLWSYTAGVSPAPPTGSLLASKDFTGVTANGWQTVTFNQPILITAGTIYIASYRTPQYYARNTNYFNDNPVTTGPLTAPASLAPYTDPNTGNGLNFDPGTDSYFKNSPFGVNYWIDVDFVPNEILYEVTSITESGGCVNSGAPLTSFTVTSVDCNTLCTAPTASIAATGTCDGSSFNVTLATATGTGPFDLVINGTTYTGISVGNPIITGVTTPSVNLWPAGLAEAALALPSGNADADNGGPVELGMKFQSSVSGFVKGIRFYNGTNTAGTFTGTLWSYTAGISPAPPTGSVLATATFVGVTANGWQQVSFSEPVLISAGTVYIASYHTPQYYARNTNYFNDNPVTTGPLTAPASLAPYTDPNTGNGLNFDPGTDSYFKNSPFGVNYWVDVVFAPNVTTYNLTSVTDAATCNSTGAPLQTLSVTSVDCSTLPVSLAGLSATPKDNSVVLRWSTSSEINNLGFEVQRSTDGAHWSTLTFVNGAGNSTSTRNYSYVDENLAARRYYYRLKQVDIDQRFVYSPVVSAVLDGKETFSLDQNYPNPFRSETILKFTLPRAAKVNLSLFDMNGRLVKVLVNESKESGTHAISFNAGSLSSGLYYYKLQAGDFSAVKKMTIQ